MRYLIAFLMLTLTMPALSENIIILDEDLEPAIAVGFDVPPYQRVLDNIIGSADFEKMRNLPPDSVDYQLGQKVGLFVIPTRWVPTRYHFCTGFLVGPDLFMTNHHCIHEEGEPLPLNGALIFMEYYWKTDIDPTRGGVSARVSAVLHADAEKDYALLRLDKPIGNIYGWLQLDTTTQVDSSQSVKLISHNGGRSKEIVRRNSQIVDVPADHPFARFPFGLAYLADSEGGSSGSPVFLKEGNTVIGIHHSAWTRNFRPDFNAGSLMSHIVPEIQQWLPQAGATTPDISVSQPRLDRNQVRPNERFEFSVSIRNIGTVASPATSLQYYRSIDNIITADDELVHVELLGSMSPNSVVELILPFEAPSTLGTYYYGVCVEPVSGDPRPDNDCSKTVMLTVSDTPLIQMYWTDSGRNIQRGYTDGSHIETLVSWVHGNGNIARLDLDMVNRKMYWLDSHEDKIKRANLDGTNIEDIVTLPNFSEYISEYALDSAGGMIYYTNSNGTHRARLDGSDVETLFSNRGVAVDYSMALDMTAGKIYGIGYGRDGNNIQRANLNGSHKENLVTGLGTSGGFDLILDTANGKMYWTTFNGKKIQRANLDGSHVEDILTSNDGLVSPAGIALDINAGKMYWTDFEAGRIQRANLDGSNIDILITKAENIGSMALGLRAENMIRPIQLSPNSLADQTFTVGEDSNILMPVAHGGTPPYTYELELSPSLPSGLAFDPVNRSISGTPTAALPLTTFFFTATDTTNTSATVTFTIEVIEDEPPPTILDVNGDGQVNVLDLVWVAMFYGKRGADLSTDVNNDGIVNVQDFILVAEVVDANLAADIPADLIEEALWEMIDNIAGAPSQTYTTALLPNYPNPFNPETWIPYTLSDSVDVAIEIYASDGSLVRRLDIGHQPSGLYVNKARAAYWNGRNMSGEPVASGLYFYTLIAGDYAATQKMLIRR